MRHDATEEISDCRIIGWLVGRRANKVSGRKRSGGSSCSRGFTLIELLVVIAIISLLIGLLLVGVNKARVAGARTSTEQLMSSIEQGMTAFRNDFGYFPPLIKEVGWGLGEVQIENNPRRAGFYSTLTLAPYLLGTGDLNGDGQIDDDYDDGQQGLGFRDPGVDREWGETYSNVTFGNGRTAYWKSKEQTINGVKKVTGKIYGPYIQLTDQYVVQTALTRNGGYYGGGSSDDARQIYEIRDAWDHAIRYYRDWPTDYVNGGRTIEDDLPAWFGSMQPDEVSSFKVQLKSAGYVLMSLGPDTKVNDTQISDPKKVNKDNMVRAGQ